MNRIREGYVLVRNPMNRRRISRIPLHREVVDCLVFWTKNPAAFLAKLPALKDWNCYFQFTLTPYDRSIEPFVPRKQQIIADFIRLAALIGKQRVIWRYDPILLTDQIDVAYHVKHFEYLARQLADCTEKCVVSFVAEYPKKRQNFKKGRIRPPGLPEKLSIAKSIAEICAAFDIVPESCAQDIDLDELGIHHGKCIDDRLIERILGVGLDIEKDKGQRKSCGCVASIDIGQYNTCLHNCVYCYANFGHAAAANNARRHSGDSSLLIGDIEPGDKVTDRKAESCVRRQRTLFG